MASHELMIDDRLVHSEECSELQVGREILDHTTLASLELQSRNSREALRVRRAQVDLAKAVGLLLLALVFFVLSALFDEQESPVKQLISDTISSNEIEEPISSNDIEDDGD